jgi:hypothetical protein
MARVKALKDHVKKSVKHPIGKRGFDENGEANWPDDAFTARRVRDGDIEILEAGGDPPKGAAVQGARQAAAPAGPKTK